MLFVVAFLQFSVPLTAFAAEPAPNPVEDTFGIGYAGTTSLGSQDIRVTIANIIQVALGILGIVALIIVIYGGVRYMTAGGDDAKVTDAKKILINGAIGLAIILSAFAITRFIFNQLSKATGSGVVPGAQGLCADPIFANANPDICLRDDGEFDDGDDCNLADALVVRSVTPNTAATNINDVKIRVVLSQDAQEDDPGQIFNIAKRNDRGEFQNINGQYQFAFVGAKKVIEATYIGDNLCVGEPCSSNGKYAVNVIAEGVEEQVAGCPEQIFQKDAEFIINTDSQLDDADPVITLLTINGSNERDIRLARGRTYVIAANVEDTAGAGYVRLEIIKDRDGSRFVAYDGPLTRDTSDAVAGLPYQFRYRFSLPAQAVPLERYRVHVTAYDIDSKIAEEVSSFVVIGDHCSNGIVDGDEPGPDPDVGGSCPGNGACINNQQCVSNLCIEGQCAVGVPKITNVSPFEGASGNLISIQGENFGGVPGQIQFVVNNDSTNPDNIIEAQIAQCGNGRQSWRNNVIVVQIPDDREGFVEGSLSSIRMTKAPVAGQVGLPMGDSTTDNFGPRPGPREGMFLKNDRVLPGICDVVPASGRDVADPNEFVAILGQNFLDVQGENRVEFDDRPGAVGADDWTDNSIRSRVPENVSGTLGVSVLIGEKRSNVFPLPIATINDNSLPIIGSLDPATTTRGSLVTIKGENFGFRTGRVLLAPSAESACEDGGDCILGDVFISELCQESNWKNTSIVFQVPEEGIPLAGKMYIIVEKTGNGLALRSKESFPLEIVDGEPAPGLCNVTPDRGPAPLPNGHPGLKITGLNFVPNSRVYFFRRGGDPNNVNTWLSLDIANFVVGHANEQFMTPIPFNQADGESMTTGPIRVVNNARQSNPVQYTAENCTELDPTKIPDGFRCCKSGRDEGILKKIPALCSDEVREAGYVWRFTTGKIPIPPKVLEQCDLPSPSPSVFWGADGKNACLNSEITLTFSTRMDFDTLRDPGDTSPRNIHVYTCGSGQKPTCDYAQNDISANFQVVTARGGGNLGDFVILRENNGRHIANTWHRVVLDKTIMSEKEELVLGEVQIKREKILATRPLDGLQNSAYVFDFKTSDNDADIDGDGQSDSGLCSLKSANIRPVRYITHLLGIIPENPVRPDINTPLYYYVKGKTEQVCTQINVDGLGWSWNVADDHLDPVDQDFAHVVLAPDGLPEGASLYSDSRATVEAVAHTQGEDIFINARVVRDGSTINATSSLAIALGDPVVTLWAPNCVEACINASVRVEFNIAMAMDTFPAGTRVYKCENANCINKQLVNPNNYTFTQSDSRSFTLSFTQGGAPLYLDKNAYYKVVLNGEETPEAIQSVNRLDPLEYGKPLPLFDWIFRTKNDDAPCIASAVSISPQRYEASRIGEKAFYTVTPKSSPDQCNSRGQLLNPYEYGWIWNSSDSQVASVSNFNTPVLRKPYCSSTCLPSGSDILLAGGNLNANIPSCGDGRVDLELGESCDIGPGSGEIANITCSLNCLRPGNTDKGVDLGQCGNDIVDSPSTNGENKGEECDPGNFQDELGQFHVISNDPFCSDTCQLRGSSRYVDSSQIPQFDDAQGNLIGASNCGDGEITEGENCEYDFTELRSNVGCSEECIKIGTQTAAFWCQEVQNDAFLQNDECRGSLSICGNGRIELGEECEPGINGAVGPDMNGDPSAVTCNARCLWQNLCGTAQAQCSAGEIGCLNDCTLAGSSLLYSEVDLNLLPDSVEVGGPSLCGDGVVGIGEDSQCEVEVLDASDPTPGDNPSQIVTAIGEGVDQNGIQQSIISAQVKSQSLPSGTSRDLQAQNIRDESEFALQCGFSEFATKRRITADGGFLPIGSENFMRDGDMEGDENPVRNGNGWKPYFAAQVFDGDNLLEKSRRTAFSGAQSMHMVFISDANRRGNSERGMYQDLLLGTGQYRLNFKYKILRGRIETHLGGNNIAASFDGRPKDIIDSGIPPEGEGQVVHRCETVGNACVADNDCGGLWESGANNEWVSILVGGNQPCRVVGVNPAASNQQFFLVKEEAGISHDANGNQVPALIHYAGNQNGDCSVIERYQDAEGNINVAFVPTTVDSRNVASQEKTLVADENQELSFLDDAVLSWFLPVPVQIFGQEVCQERVLPPDQEVNPNDFPWQTFSRDFTIDPNNSRPRPVVTVFGEAYIDDFEVIRLDEVGQYNNCPYAVGEAENNSKGVGANSCCYPRGALTNAYPQDGAGIIGVVGEDDLVCRNTVINLEFDRQIDTETIEGNAFVVRGYTTAELRARGIDEMRCPDEERDVSSLVAKSQQLAYIHSDAQQDPQNLWQKVWFAIRNFWRKVLSSLVFASNVPENSINVDIWCAGKVDVAGRVQNIPQVGIEENAENAVHSKVTLQLQNVLDPTAVYALLIKGGVEGIKDTRGVGVRASQMINGEFPIYDSVIFKTGQNICRIDHVAVVPDSQIFTIPNQTETFSARAISANGQEIGPTPVYDFSWDWGPQRNPLFSIPVENTMSTQPQIQIASKNVEGRLSAIANARVTTDVSRVDSHEARIFSGFSTLESLFCENPWPAREVYPYEEGISFEKIREGAPNNDGFSVAQKQFDGTPISSVLYEGNEEYFNFKMSYCADAGRSGTTNDDLPYLQPKVISTTVAPKVCQVSENSCTTNNDCGFVWIRDDRDVVIASAGSRVCGARSFVEQFVASHQEDSLSINGRQLTVDTGYACNDASDCNRVDVYGDGLVIRDDRGRYRRVEGDELQNIVQSSVCIPLGGLTNREQCIEDPYFPLESKPIKQFLMFSDINDDAIGIQVYSNPTRISAYDWYSSHYNNIQDYRRIVVGGYDAISNGDNYYVNALNILSTGDVKNFIYLFTLNEGASSNTNEVFQRLIDSLEFNINLSDFGYCSAPFPVPDGEDRYSAAPEALLDTPSGEKQIACSTDFDCIDAGGAPIAGTGGICSNTKTKFLRDWDRLQNLQTVQRSIEGYFANTGSYPGLEGGTFIPGYTNSRWGSWDGRFGETLNVSAGLDTDPINEWSSCGYCTENTSTFCTNDQQCGDAGPCQLTDPQTCWSADQRLLVCPAVSQIFEYNKTNDGGYRLHGHLEFFDLLDGIVDEFLPDTSKFTTDSWCTPGRIESPFVESCGDGIVNTNANEMCDPPGSFSLVQRGAPSGNGMCQLSRDNCDLANACRAYIPIDRSIDGSSRTFIGLGDLGKMGVCVGPNSSLTDEEIQRNRDLGVPLDIGNINILAERYAYRIEDYVDLFDRAGNINNFPIQFIGCNDTQECRNIETYRRPTNEIGITNMLPDDGTLFLDYQNGNPNGPFAQQFFNANGNSIECVPLSYFYGGQGRSPQVEACIPDEQDNLVDCPAGQRALRSCSLTCQYEYSACTPIGECGNGVVEAGEVCDDGALNGEYGQCSRDCRQRSGNYCGNGQIDTNANGQPIEYCEVVSGFDFVTRPLDGSKMRFSVGGSGIDPTRFLAGDNIKDDLLQNIRDNCQNCDGFVVGLITAIGFVDLNANAPVMFAHRCTNDPTLICNPARDNEDCNAPPSEKTVSMGRPFSGDDFLSAFTDQLQNFGQCEVRLGRYGASYDQKQQFSCAWDCKQSGEYCGDGLFQPDYEECDDSNGRNIDGCNNLCQQENIACIEATPQGEVVAANGQTTITKNYGENTVAACLNTTGNEICRGLGFECIRAEGAAGDSCGTLLTSEIGRNVAIVCDGELSQQQQEQVGSGIAGSCGDGVVQGDDGEACDRGAQNGVACNTVYGQSCTYCSDDCRQILTVDADSYCGNGQIDLVPGPAIAFGLRTEACDFDAQGNVITGLPGLEEIISCGTIATPGRVPKGTLTCENNCTTLNTSDCIACGEYEDIACVGQGCRPPEIIDLTKPIPKLAVLNVLSPLAANQNWANQSELLASINENGPTMHRVLVLNNDLSTWQRRSPLTGNNTTPTMCQSLGWGSSGADTVYEASCTGRTPEECRALHKKFTNASDQGNYMQQQWLCSASPYYFPLDRGYGYLKIQNLDEADSTLWQWDQYTEKVRGLESDERCDGEYSVYFGSRGIQEKKLNEFPNRNEEKQAFYERYGDFFPYPVNGERRTIENEYVVSPAVPINTLRAVVRYKDASANGGQNKFVGNVFVLSSARDQRGPLAGYASAPTLAAQDQRNYLCSEMEKKTAVARTCDLSRQDCDVWGPKNCTSQNRGIWVHDIGQLQKNYAQATSFQIFQEVRNNPGQLYGFFVEGIGPGGNLPINNYRGQEMSVELYEYHEGQVPEYSLYKPTHVYRLAKSRGSQNPLARYWHVFNIRINADETYSVEDVEDANNQSASNGAVASCFANIICNMNGQCNPELLPENCR